MTLSFRLGATIALTLISFVASSHFAASEEVDKELLKRIELQVHLSRANASPGPIDGRMGKNTRSAIKAFQRMNNLKADGVMGPKTEAALERVSNTSQPALKSYTITEEDSNGPFIKELPDRLIDMVELDQLNYTNALELLAEKFHMTEELVQRLNPSAKFSTAGTKIRVANPDRSPFNVQVGRIAVVKSSQTLHAFDSEGKEIAVYPATIGSQETPSPEGQRNVIKIAKLPTYTYDPEKLDFKGVEAKKKFTIAAGPNNPVGLVWIELDAPGYGIHGSPDPRNIRREASHGCVRLTNWDALHLVDAVRDGTEVNFSDELPTQSND